MEVRKVGSNMTEVRYNGATILVSYSTPVAAYTDGRYVRTSKRWSVTTSRHINKWLDGLAAEEVDQSVLDALLK